MPQDIIPAGSFFPTRSEESNSWETTKQLCFVIFKWKRLILSLFLVFTVAAGAAMVLKPPAHRAVAKFMLKRDRMPLRISGLAALSLKTPHSPQILQSEIELLKSREVLLFVAKNLLSRNGRREKDLSIGEIEAMIDSLSRNTVATTVPNTNVIQVTYFSPTSEEAEETLGLIIDQYLEKQAAIQSGSPKLLEFYEQEGKRVGVELREAEDKLKNWQEENQTVSIDDHITAQLARFVDRENTLQQTVAQFEMTRAKIAILQKQLSSEPERLVTSRAHVLNPLVTRIKNDLMTAGVSLQDLLQRYTGKDRRVREKRVQIALLKQQLAAAEKEEIIGTKIIALNPLRGSLKKELTDAQALMISLGSQKVILRRQIRETQAGLAILRDKKVGIDRLSRQVDLRKGAFILYEKKLEEAKIATGLGKEQLASIALLEHPHAIDSSDLKNRILMVILAAIVGLALGLAVAFGFEFFNNSIRTQADIEHYLGYPMLAALPDLRGRPQVLEG